MAFPTSRWRSTHIDLRIRQMEGEGVIFRPRMHVGIDVSVQRLLDDYQVIVLAGGAEKPRDLPIPGRELDGVHYAMDFLTQQNKRVAGDDEKTAAPGGTISRQGQACDRHRRRRHGLGLHRHVQPPWRGVGHAARDHAEAADAGEQADDVAGLAAEAAHVVLATKKAASATGLSSPSARSAKAAR